jgi:DNA-directed RNA polymerase beta' subunit
MRVRKMDEKEGKLKWHHVMVDEATFNDCLVAADVDLSRLPEHKRLCEYYGVPYLSGRSLFSLVLPQYFEYEKRTDTDPEEPIVQFREGILIKGVMCKKVLGNVSNSIIQYLAKWGKQREAIDFITNSQRLLARWGQSQGFSVGIVDCMPKKTAKKMEPGGGVEKADDKESIMRKKIQDLIDQARLYQINKEKSDNPAEQKRLESLINDTLCTATDIGAVYAKEVIGESRFGIMEKSGARGSMGNIVNIMSLLGQINVQGGRIQRDRTGRTLTSFKKNDPRPASQGMCESSFFEGLDPDQHFMQMMSSREQVMTGISKTPEAGYLERTLIKLFENNKVHYDRTVRDGQNRIVQYVYGEDDFDGTKLLALPGRSRVYFTDVKYHAKVLNASYLRAKKEQKE